MPIYLGGLVFLLVFGCNSKIADKIADKGVDIDQSVLSEKLNLNLGQGVELDMLLDVLCGMVGTPGEDCRQQLFRSQYSSFRAYPAIFNRYPGMVITAVDNSGKDLEIQGRDNFIKLSINAQKKMDPVQGIAKATAVKGVEEFRLLFPMVTKAFTINYGEFLNLFSTVTQQSPPGQKPLKNHMAFGIHLEKNGKVDFYVKTFLGNAQIARVPLNNYLPVWAKTCPGQCDPPGSYFIPTTEK